MGVDFVGEMCRDQPRIQEYAREYRAGDKTNQPELDRAIAVMLSRSLDAVKAALNRRSDVPEIEARRLANHKWRKIFTSYTYGIAVVVVAGAVASIWGINKYGGGTANAKLSYWLYALLAVLVAGLTVCLLNRLRLSTKEFIIECILHYDVAQAPPARNELWFLENDVVAGSFAAPRQEAGGAQQKDDGAKDQEEGENP